MNPIRVFARRGAALVISLIMLVLITLLVITALNLGPANFRAVSNTQFRDEAIAAANAAIQLRLSGQFRRAAGRGPLRRWTSTTTASRLHRPGHAHLHQCSGRGNRRPSSASLPPAMSLASTWNTVWDIAAAVARRRRHVGRRPLGRACVARPGGRRRGAPISSLRESHHEEPTIEFLRWLRPAAVRRPGDVRRHGPVRPARPGWGAAERAARHRQCRQVLGNAPASSRHRVDATRPRRAIGSRLP